MLSLSCNSSLILLILYVFSLSPADRDSTRAIYVTSLALNGKFAKSWYSVGPVDALG
jgi:hypothetical protein